MTGLVEHPEVVAQVLAQAITATDDRPARSVTDVALSDQFVDHVEIAADPHVVEPATNHLGRIDVSGPAPSIAFPGHAGRSTESVPLIRMTVG